MDSGTFEGTQDDEARYVFRFPDGTFRSWPKEHPAVAALRRAFAYRALKQSSVPFSATFSAEDLKAGTIVSLVEK